MIHLYALCREVTAAALSGIDEAPLEHLAVGELAAVISRHPEPLRTTPEAALTHVAVIEALAGHTDVLPVQLGRGHTDDSALHAKLEVALPQLRGALDRVGGHVELVVRPVVPPASTSAPAPTPETGAGGPGRAYLERQRAVQRAAAEASAQLRDRLTDLTAPLAEVAAAVHDTIGRHGPERCFLVARSDASAFGRRARELLRGDDSLLIGGPWPPFTFAALAADAEVVG